MKKKQIIFSGIQPSGHLMIGNYIGSIKQWLQLQDDYDCLFSLVDLHAITVQQEPPVLRNHCMDLITLYMACGLDPDKCVLFIQSHVSAHAELAWILNCFTQLGALNRMTQFKDKSKRYASNINAGLYAYPVLQAADILLYGANLVPVGKDQKQHIELTRDIAIRFNNTYGDVFVVPEYLAPPAGERIMSLQDPSKKMSKSDENKNSYVALLDPPDRIRQKLKRAVTDSGKEIVYDASKPGISNLLTLYAIITDTPINQLVEQYAGKGYGAFKQDLGNVLADFLSPIQERFAKLRKNENNIRKILQHGAQIARKRAQPMLDRAHDVIGLLPQ